MPKFIISNPTISDPWTHVSNIRDPRPLHFVKGVAGTSGPLENREPSATRDDKGDGLSNPTHSTIQRPPQSAIPPSLFDPGDPAFSTDPHHHPDHHGLSLSDGLGKGGHPSALHFTEAELEPPPAYDDNVPDSSESLGRPHLQYELTSSLASDSVEDVRGSGHLRERAQASYSSASSPFSSTTNLPQSQHDVQDDMADQDELLAYLQEDRIGADVMHEREVPMSLRPHMGLPVTSQVTSQVPTDSQRRGRPGPGTEGLLRSATSPPAAMRTVSEPLTATNTERPRLPRRGNTASPRRVMDLDRIDELDETTPLGMPLHHRGPYEVRGKVDTPPVRAMPLDRQHQPIPKQHVLVAATPADAPPAPVPFRLNLKPGEFLTRVPPMRSRTTPPERNPPLATGPYPPVSAMQPMYQRPRPIAHDQLNSRYAHPDNELNEWSPEQLYENQTFSSPPMISRDVPRHPYRVDTRNNSHSSSASTSRSEMRSNIGSNSDLSLPHGRPARQKQVSFQQPPQQPSSLSRSISQPLYPPSSSASAYSASSSSLSRAPPSSADRHRPKRIVMPAPLQQQNRNFMQTVPSDMNYKLGQNGVSAPPAAAVIPVHEPKKGNLLKKRASTGSSTHQNHKHLAPERVPSTKGIFSLGVGFGRSLAQEPELNLPKASRKLSKRSKAV